MKRLVMTWMAACCLSAATFAAGNQPTTEKWEGTVNVNKLSKYLKLTAAQHDEVANICEYFNEQMGRATRSSKDQEKLIHNAVYGNLKLMKNTLDAKQYAAYAKVLNVTLKNKGIEVK
ncbi:MAG: hypothetical protein ACI37U_00895 [Bacteroides sp.]